MKRLVIGFGNSFRRDDGAGLAVAEQVHGPDAIPAGDGAIEVVDKMAGYDEVILVDAVCSGAAPGTVHRFDAGRCYPRSWGGSSHSMGLPEVLAIAKALETLPDRAQVVGIEVAETGQGEGLSVPVAAAVSSLVEELSDA